MTDPSTAYARRFDAGLLLDRRWHQLRGEPLIDKHDAVSATALAFEEAGVPWAIIDGVALQLRLQDPRTTVDLDIAVLDRASLPRLALQRQGFQSTGTFDHSENWTAPDGTPVQFADDPRMAGAVARAELVPIDGLRLRVVTARDLLRLKLLAASDATRRRSKRTRDLADCQALIEENPEIAVELTADERAWLAV